MKNPVSKIAGALPALCFAATAGMADVQHLDDVIITFSLCVGNDCVNGENFGFDTVRLKENNLRINFDDTSVSASFPRRDWRIVVNDSSNGGAEYFRIEDSTAGRAVFQIDGGAPTNAVRIDADGDMGIGTANPIVEAHLVDGNTPTMRLEQDGSSGFTSQTWDVAGNETNFFVPDVTGSSKLPFRIKPRAPDDSVFIAASGNVGMGTDSPQQALHIRRTASAENVEIELENPNTGGTGSGNWRLLVRGADGEFAINDDGPTATGAEFIFRGPTAQAPEVRGLDMRGTLDATDDVIAGNQLICNGTAGACVMQTSDIRLKPNATTITNAAEIIRELRPIQWSDPEQGTSTGLAAQEVAAVMEAHGLADWTGHKLARDGDTHMLSYTALVGLLVGAHQEKDQRIARLEAQVQELLSAR